MAVLRSRLIEQAFLRCAQALDRQFPGAEPGAMEYTARLSLLRRAVLGEIRGAALPSTPAAEWEFGEEHGCPLLDPALDVLEPRAAYGCSLQLDREGATSEWGELYQELRGVLLERDPTGQLVPGRSQSARRQLGIFYTPVWMARRLSAMALSDPGLLSEAGVARRAIRIFDPACGSGRLLRACAEAWLAHTPEAHWPDAVRGELAGILSGADLDPLAVALSRTVFWRLADPRRGPFPALQEMFVVQDSLLAAPGQTGEGRDYDVIVANPPFDVLKGFAKRDGLKEYVARLRQGGYEWSLSGSLNTARLFLERGLQLLREGGRLAFVLPASFLMDKTAAGLRGEMLRRGWLVEIEGYPESARVFRGVGQSVILLHAHKVAQPNPSFHVRYGEGEGERVELSLARLASIDPDTLPIPLSSGESYDLVGKMNRLNAARLGDLAEGKVGEVDQTFYRPFILSRPGEALLLRGAHLGPYRANLLETEPKERWLDAAGFFRARPTGAWREDIRGSRIAQTGIVNMEAARRLVAAEVPEGVYLGNSLNYWIPRDAGGLDPAQGRGYLLGLLNSSPWEWRFRFTSSNNNINLYEARALPLPASGQGRGPAAQAGYVAFAAKLIGECDWPEGVLQITAGPAAPGREDLAVMRLIAAVARKRAGAARPDEVRRLDRWIDALVSFHLGLSEEDLLTIWKSLGRA